MTQSNKHQLIQEAAFALQTTSNQDEEEEQAVAEVIADLCESILEDPRSALIGSGSEETKSPSKVKLLLKYASLNDEYVAQLAMVSLLAVLKDILPSYRIRLPTTSEMAVKVSKDTKQLWDYERCVLQSYQDYLKLLEKIWNAEKNDPGPLAVTAILCLAQLLQSALHFNFRSNLITIAVRNMNHNVHAVSQACCTAIEHVFRKDAQGHVALEATRQVAKMIRDRNFRVQPPVLRTFKALPLRVHVDEAQAAKLASQANAKKRKRDKEAAEIEKELQESQATVDKIVLARCQSDILQTITLTYFRILKNENGKATHMEELLPAALEGLGHFSHLINIDTAMDMLQVLRDLLKNADALSLEAALNCVLAAFQTLQGPGKELKIDVKEYILPLYSLLPRLCTEFNSRKHTDLMLECLTAAFVKRREFSSIRIAAFLLKMFAVAAETPPHTSVPLLALSRQLLQRYPAAQQILENEEDTIASGNYNPTVEDPEHSSPFATSAWELAMLKFHIHPAIAGQAVATASLKMLQLPAEAPEKLRSDLMTDADDLYISFQRYKKRHPLEPKDEQEQKKRRRQLRFITPRAYERTIVPQI